MKVRIVRCSVHGAWYEARIGEVVTVFATDSYGHWTRDTGRLRCSQWIKVADTEPVKPPCRHCVAHDRDCLFGDVPWCSYRDLTAPSTASQDAPASPGRVR